MATQEMHRTRETSLSRRPSIRIVWIISVLLGAMLPPTFAQTEANKALVTRVFTQDVCTPGYLDEVDEFNTSDYVYHGTGGDQDLEAIKQPILALCEIFPDQQWNLEDMIAEGDKVAARWTFTGTHQPTGIYITMPLIRISRIREGKIAEEWSHPDELGLMEQLGVMPPTRQSYTWGESSSVSGDPGDPEANKALVHRLFAEAITGNLDIIDELIAADYLFHDPVSPVEVRGPEGYKQEFGMYLTAFPDIQIALEDMIAEGDKVAIRWTLSGTHGGELMGIGPSGTPVTVTGISMYRMADGKFVETWASYDALGMIQQLTAPPTWPIAGAWITNVPIPDLGVIVGEWTVVPQDAAGLAFTSEIRAAKPDPTIFGNFPDCDHESDHIGTTRWTASLAYESTWIGYGTKPAETPGQLPEIVYISILSGKARFVDRNTLAGEGTHAFYLGSQDVDGDGFPDEGEAPIACFPYASTARRVQLLPPCVPPAPEAANE
ncbi:MAG: ester cyclase [Phycisphaerales bacterium]|nr:MAG: ester cyclase [Phycisphaerales bacterium]